MFICETRIIAGVSIPTQAGRGAAFGASDLEYDAIVYATVAYELEKRLSDTQKRSTDLLRAEKNKVDKIRVRLEAVKKTAREEQQRAAELEMSRIDVQRANEESRRKMQRTLKEMKNLESEVRVMKIAIGAKDKTIERLEKSKKSALNKKESDMKRLQQRTNDLVQDFKAVEQELQDMQADVEALRRLVAEAEHQKLELRTKLEQSQTSLARKSEEQKHLKDLLMRNTNRSKNRGRALKKAREKLAALQDEFKETSSLLKPKRKFRKSFGDLRSRNQRSKRIKMYKEKLVIVQKKLMDGYMIDVDGYGPMEIVTTVEEDDVVISFRKGSSNEDKIRQYVKLHDEGISLKKIQKIRMLSPWTVPKREDLRNKIKLLNDEARELFDIKVDEKSFHAFPEQTILHMIKKHKIKVPDGRIDIGVTGDGRGTGSSLHTVKMQFVILQEGRKTFKRNRLLNRCCIITNEPSFICFNDRQYFLCLVKGSENRSEMPDLLKPTLNALEKLQRDGLYVGGEKIDVFLHLWADAKFIQICCGTPRFCEDKENCTMCYSRPSEREDPLLRWPIEEGRYHHEIDKHGLQSPDLFHFIPMSRRWPEGMHMVLRFAHDKLVKAGLTEIICNEMKEEGKGLKFIEEEMHAIGIGSFHFKAVKGKDPTSMGGWTYRSLSFTEVCEVAEEFDFVHGFEKNQEKGRRLQEVLRSWMRLYRMVYCCFPGDGPPVSAEEMFHVHSDLFSKLTQGVDAEPGEEEDEVEQDAGWPLHMIRTYYAHTWHTHVPDLYERSKQYAPLFNDPESLDENPELWGGGLKPFRTDALERSNLLYFHQYFQQMNRQPKLVMEQSGMLECRLMLDNQEEHPLWCAHCGKGYKQRKSLHSHEATCRQAPIDNSATSYAI